MIDFDALHTRTEQGNAQSILILIITNNLLRLTDTKD